ncbi:hypothetical protein [Jeotgalicoccus sp. WY2]
MKSVGGYLVIDEAYGEFALGSSVVLKASILSLCER